MLDVSGDSVDVAHFVSLGLELRPHRLQLALLDTLVHRHREGVVWQEVYDETGPLANEGTLADAHSKSPVDTGAFGGRETLGPLADVHPRSSVNAGVFGRLDTVGPLAGARHWGWNYLTDTRS